MRSQENINIAREPVQRIKKAAMPIDQGGQTDVSVTGHSSWLRNPNGSHMQLRSFVIHHIETLRINTDSDQLTGRETPTSPSARSWQPWPQLSAGEQRHRQGHLGMCRGAARRSCNLSAAAPHTPHPQSWEASLNEPTGDARERAHEGPQRKRRSCTTACRGPQTSCRRRLHAAGLPSSAASSPAGCAR